MLKPQIHLMTSFDLELHVHVTLFSQIWLADIVLGWRWSSDS